VSGGVSGMDVLMVIGVYSFMHHAHCSVMC